MIATPRRPTQPPRVPTLVDGQQLTEALGWPPRRLPRLRRRRSIPGVVRVGRRVYYNLDIVVAWLERGGSPEPGE